MAREQASLMIWLKSPYINRQCFSPVLRVTHDMIIINKHPSKSLLMIVSVARNLQARFKTEKESDEARRLTSARIKALIT